MTNWSLKRRTTKLKRLNSWLRKQWKTLCISTFRLLPKRVPDKTGPKRISLKVNADLQLVFFRFELTAGGQDILSPRGANRRCITGMIQHFGKGMNTVVGAWLKTTARPGIKRYQVEFGVNLLKDRPNAADLRAVKAEIEFDGVSFAYAGRENLFENLNLTIKAGEKVGKITVCRLLCMYQDLNIGKLPKNWDFRWEQ